MSIELLREEWGQDRGVLRVYELTRSDMIAEARCVDPERRLPWRVHVIPRPTGRHREATVPTQGMVLEVLEALETLVSVGML